MDSISLIVGVLAGAVSAGAVVYALCRLRQAHELADAKGLSERSRELGEQLTALQQTNADLNNARESLSLELAAAETRLERVPELEKRLSASERNVSSQREENEKLKLRLAEMETRIAEERRAAAEKLELLQKAEEQLAERFNNLATQIMEKNSATFAERNKKGLDALLTPLREKIGDFEKQVRETNEKNIAARTSLLEELKGLRDLNHRLSEDAVNLTRALKGGSKTQGNWGELVLERVLEESGLRKGDEYETQSSQTADDGRRLQPDVIVRLPEDKHLIIDSKVSLTAYERCISAETDDARRSALREHVASVRQHIRELGEKAYQERTGLTTPDFVLMFIPIESAFGMAVQEETELFFEAFRSNIVLVTPSTLLATLRTVGHIWRHERQTRNVQEIARVSGLLYNKFEGFISDMQDLDQRLQQARRSFDHAFSRLSTGRGNLVRTAERLRHLGASTSKRLPAELLDDETPE